MTRSGGQFALVSPTPNSGGLAPRPPVIYAHASQSSFPWLTGVKTFKICYRFSTRSNLRYDTIRRDL